MEITIKRTKYFDDCTIGEMSIDGVFFSYTLEDTDRKIEELGCSVKVYGKTAIPKGKYLIAMTYSPRFKQYMPLLMNVPCFTGIRIHAGNVNMDTEGCILCGFKNRDKMILESRKATSELYKILTKVEKKEKITVTIE